MRIPRLVAFQQQVVEIELGDNLVAAFELHFSQRALAGRPARGQQRVDEGRERADRVAAGLAHLADDEHLDRAQLAERHHHVEVLEHPRYRAAHAQVEILVTGRRDVDGPDLRNVDAAIAIDCGANIDIDLAPGADHDLVPRTDYVVGWDGHPVQRRKDYVVGWDGHPVQRRKSGKRAVEQVVAEHRQVPPGRLEHEFLELVALQGRSGKLLLIGGKLLLIGGTPLRTALRRLIVNSVGADRPLRIDDGRRLDG